MIAPLKCVGGYADIWWFKCDVDVDFYDESRRCKLANMQWSEVRATVSVKHDSIIFRTSILRVGKVKSDN